MGAYIDRLLVLFLLLLGGGSLLLLFHLLGLGSRDSDLLIVGLILLLGVGPAYIRTSRGVRSEKRANEKERKEKKGRKQ